MWVNENWKMVVFDKGQKKVAIHSCGDEKWDDDASEIRRLNDEAQRAMEKFECREEKGEVLYTVK